MASVTEHPDLGLLTVVELLRISQQYIHIPTSKRLKKASIIQYLEEHNIPELHQSLLKAVEAKDLAKVAKREALSSSHKKKRNIQQQARRLAASIIEPSVQSVDVEQYLSLPTSEEVLQCYRRFHHATSSQALKMSVCGVCSREELEKVMKTTCLPLHAIPNSSRLKPARPHLAQQLTEGLLLELKGLVMKDGECHVCICAECYSELLKANEHPPKFALANGIWIGEQPWQLKALTFPEQLLISLVYPRVFVFKLFPKVDSYGMDPDSLQRGMRGTVSSFELDMEGISDMIHGNLLPRQPAILASIISVTFIGRGKIPKRYLRRVFRVRRKVIFNALTWLVMNNPKYFGNIQISNEHLQQIPEDDVPNEILDTMRQFEDEEVLAREDDNYVNRESGRVSTEFERDDNDLGASDMPERNQKSEPMSNQHEDPDVVPLDISGATDVDLSRLSANELMVWGLANLWKEGKEGGYEIHHGTRPVRDFGPSRSSARDAIATDNYWEKSFPFLFPYGCGGFESPKPTHLELREHVRWALLHHDKRFRKHETFPFVAIGILQRREALASAKVQIHSRSYEKNARLINSVTLDKLLQAEVAERNGSQVVTDPGVYFLKNQVKAAAGRVMGSDQSRIKLRSQIWSTTMYLGPPTVWLTINPSDIHDPIAQVFVGEDINLDQFCPTSGPDATKRAKNIAADPYAAAKFFHFIIDTVFETLLGIQIVKHKVKSGPGIFGNISAYFGTVESQGRGTLHLHTLIWLRNTPSPDELHRMLGMPSFRDKVRQFIKANFRAYVPGLENKESANLIPQVKDIAYSRPVNPDLPDYKTQLSQFETSLARAEQIHTCRLKRCLIVDNGGRLKCKRRAPFSCSEDDFVTEKGEWGPKRLYGYVNAWVPGILVNMRCNNDGKLLTSGEDTKNITYYVTSYAAKKQGKNFNMSAVMAKGFAYHIDQRRENYVEQLKDAQRLLLFRLLNAINREQELSAAMVVSYLMGWGEVKQSHSYTPIYWTAFVRSLLNHFPDLNKHSERSIPIDDVIEESDPPEVTNDESTNELFTLEVNSEGQFFCASQVIDYQLRGIELESYCVMDFFVDTYEEDIRKKTRSRNGSHDGNTESQTNHPRRGRPRNTRIPYLDSHPKSKDKWRVHRSKDHRNLPNLVGSQIPRNDDPNVHELYSASVLLLLKPWRKIEELKLRNENWSKALETWLQGSSNSARSQFIISGIQYHHECHSAAQESRNVEDVVYDENMLDDDCNEVFDGGHMGVHVDEPGLTEEGLSMLLASHIPMREQLHAMHAIESAKYAKIFEWNESSWKPNNHSIITGASGGDICQLHEWKEQMQNDVYQQNNESAMMVNGSLDGNYMIGEGSGPSVHPMNNMGDEDQQRISFTAEQSLSPIQPTLLKEDQLRAYNIVVWHLDETLAKRNPPPLRMIIYGEGGTGKSKVIQTVTQAFVDRGVKYLLVKAAYTGVAASLIDGKTTHKLASFNARADGSLSDDAKKKLQEFWNARTYLILDEYSMLGKTFLAKLSRNIAVGKTGSSTEKPDESFGGVNVILCGDLHQFPPVAQASNESLFKPLDIVNDPVDRQIGRGIYEEFQTVVILKEQMRVSDPVWRDFLTHLRYGQVQHNHIKMLQELIVRNGTDPAMFSEHPWTESLLVTPRHAVRQEWNHLAVRKRCREGKEFLFKCSAEDKIGERPLTLAERYAVAQRKGTEKRRRIKDLPMEVELAKGMRVLVTNNLETDLDITNGARGTIVDIMLHPDEPALEDMPVVALKLLPVCILVKLDRTRASKLNGLEEGVIPIEPMTVSFEIKLRNDAGKTIRRTVKRRQFPVTAAYAFTDYRSQGQTIPAVIVDIASPPSGSLSLFNLYVALSRSSGRETIRLLRDFEEQSFLRPHDPDLLTEDDRLEELNRETRKLWEEMQRRSSSHNSHNE